MSNIQRHQIKQIVGRKIHIGQELSLKILEVSKPGERMQVTLGIDAPESVSIIPMEYYSERVQAMKDEIEQLKKVAMPLKKTVTKVWLKNKKSLSIKPSGILCSKSKYTQVQRSRDKEEVS